MIDNVYLGAVGSIFLLNAVQWSLSRDSIYGLFTFQTLLWFLYALHLSTWRLLDLPENQEIIIHTTVNGLVVISYLELVHRLFGGMHLHRYASRWLRGVQLGLFSFILLEAGLLLTIPDPWQYTAANRYISFVYWGVLTVSCGVGMGVAARCRDAVGRFFVVGSLMLLLNESQTVFYFIGITFGITTFHNTADRTMMGQVIVGGFIIELLSFSLCLVFRQRQLAIAQAVEKARTDDQLIQERLEAELALRRVEQQKTDLQLRALQAQVNPHFLFNSLNSLSALIDEDAERASQFVNELSIVYRYLLRANDQPLTTLANELDFIQSYYQLLKTRYGDGLTLHIAINDEDRAKLLPSLTLQLLVENAVKHNVTSIKRPLTIEILTDEEGNLTVRNNRQRKTSRVLSNGVGLTAIASQYRRLQQVAPLVVDDQGQFAVTLPLLAAVPERI